MNVRRLSLAAVLLVSFISQLCVAQEITVAAAADLQFAMQDVAGPIPEGNGENREAHLWFVGEFFPANSERRSL